jgi:predicted Rossmann fold flavoprotein
MTDADVVIIGAGAAGMMAGITAAKRGRRVIVLDHADKPGEKIRISGGGRCNFTHLYSTPDNFVSENPHFCKSALSRYTPYDFLDLVESHGIAWEEKAEGQLFCQGRSQKIIDMLLTELDQADADLRLGTDVIGVAKTDRGYDVATVTQTLSCDSLVIATGGPSIPKMGATRFGYKIAEQFGLPLVEPVPALVPLTFTDAALEPIKALSGVAVDTVVTNQRTQFNEPTLFTHRGLSGPGILQISTYWKPGEAITLDMAPGVDLVATLKADRLDRPRLSPENWLAERLPKRLAAHIADGLPEQRLADMSDAQIEGIALMVGAWRLVPAGSEGYRKAEVTRGGVNTNALSSKTMECRDHPGLYFIGEVVDVTGHLGGHNFQWAWASGVACGEVC